MGMKLPIGLPMRGVSLQPTGKKSVSSSSSCCSARSLRIASSSVALGCERIGMVERNRGSVSDGFGKNRDGKVNHALNIVHTSSSGADLLAGPASGASSADLFDDLPGFSLIFCKRVWLSRIYSLSFE